MNNIKWMIRYVMKVKGGFALGMSLMLLSALFKLAITGIQKFLIDDVFLKQRYDLFIPFLTVFVIVVMLYIATWSSYAIFFSKATDRIRIIMRKEYMSYFHKMPVSLYNKERIGSMMSRMDQFLNTRYLFMWHIPVGIEQLFNLILLIVIIGYSNIYILLGATIFSVIYILLGRYFAPRIKKISSVANDKKAAFNTQIEEGISSTREIIAFHRGSWEIKKFNESFKSYFKKAFERGRLQNKQMLWSDPVKWGANLLVLGYGGYCVYEQTMSLGMFIILYQFTSQLIDAYQGLYHSVMGIIGDLAGLEHARNVMSCDQIKDGHMRLNSEVRSLRFRNVNFQYNDEQSAVLKDLDLNIPIGKKVAIVGGSGGGKSTIAQLLIRFYEPTSGGIEVDGTMLSEICREEWTDKVAIVFQEPFLFPDTIRNNLLMGRNFTDEHMEQACISAQLHNTIQSFPHGYNTILGERGITLSGGQRQRLALARALISDPEILILDEATSALDQETERFMQKELDRLRFGKTTIIIAHRLSTIENADVIFVLDEGKVVEAGTHHKLMRKDTPYRHLIRAQYQQ